MEVVEAGEVFFLIYDISIIYELVIKFKPEYIMGVKKAGEEVWNMSTLLCSCTRQEKR